MSEGERRGDAVRRRRRYWQKMEEAVITAPAAKRAYVVANDNRQYGHNRGSGKKQDNVAA